MPTSQYTEVLTFDCTDALELAQRLRRRKGVYSAHVVTLTRITVKIDNRVVTAKKIVKAGRPSRHFDGGPKKAA